MCIEYDYSFEKVGEAVYTLATSPETILSRLEKAAFYARAPQDHDVPPDLHKDFHQMKNALLCRGDYVNTVKTMTEEEAIQAAKLIYSFNRSLKQWELDYEKSKAKK